MRERGGDCNKGVKKVETEPKTAGSQGERGGGKVVH
jgi:hypothetical protein